MESTKKKLQIALVDCGNPPAVARAILRYVEQLYDIEYVRPEGADYIIHSIAGHDVLCYPGIRIFVTGEMVSANYNISDYSLSFDRLKFGDRNFWFPLIKLYTDAYQHLKQQRLPCQNIMAQKTEFCAYVMSNTKNSAVERTRIYELLNDYKKVNCGGRWNNNVGGPVADKHAFQRKHKFVIAFENYSAPGYLTEKFAEAAMADAIPIYWGDPEIGRYFNSRAFINCHDFDNLDAVVAKVIEIDQDDALYRQMLGESWFVDGVEPEELRDANFLSFIRNIFDSPKEAAYRRNRSRWGRKYERQFLRMWKRPLLHGVFRIRERLRRRGS